MSGHNRWTKIKHKKAASDAKKSKGWTKFIKEITVAARMGGGDPNGNPRLRAAIDKARADNMPMDTIGRAIKKGSGDLEAVNYEELTYEVYGPGGAALLVDILTDNRNRTASELRHLIEKGNGKLASSGAVAYQFKKRGTIVFESSAVDEDRLIFRTAEGSKLLGVVMNSDVAFEIDHITEDSATSVVLRGSAVVLEGDEADFVDTLPLRPWVDTTKLVVVCITPTEISGRTFQLHRPWLHMR